MSVGFQKPKIKSRSAGPGGKKPGTSCHGKNPVSLSIAAIPKDPPPGSSDWVAAKNSGTSSASGREGGPKRTVGWPSGRGPKGTIRDPEDFPALVPPAGSSTNLLDYKDAVDDGSKDRNRRANPKDLPPGSFDWVAAKNSSTSSASGKEGGPKRTVGWPSGRGPKGTIRDPEDFPALVPPAGSSTNLTAYTLIERFFEGPVMYWVPALMKNSNNYKVKLKFHLFWFIKNALFKLLIDSFQQKLLKLNGSKDSNGRVMMVFTESGNLDVTNNAILNIFGSIIDCSALWCRASQDAEDKQLSILESIQIRIQ